ncbi:MAG: class I SAM-dependent methyltransferase [Actinomycetota bacterium]|nr:class I SAM-dependent methyltransferase [Actinomycetota bacterium]
MDKNEELLIELTKSVKGFMPIDEGLTLNRHGNSLDIEGPLLEIGSYCGKSAIYLGFAAKETRRLLFSVDHHRGSEENQPGWEWHDPEIVDSETGLIDTLPEFRRNIKRAGLEDNIVAVVGDSPAIAKDWSTPLALLFIDGGHGSEPAHADYESWVPKLLIGGKLLIHDVFENPEEGGRPPYEIFQRALASKSFEEIDAVGSLRVLKRINSGI